MRRGTEVEREGERGGYETSLREEGGAAVGGAAEGISLGGRASLGRVDSSYYLSLSPLSCSQTLLKGGRK